MRTMLKTLAIITLAAATASAQGLGDQLRLHGPQGVIEGQVLRMDSRSLVIDQGRSNVTVARAQVDSMFRRGSYAKEATVGLGFFGALGGGLAAMSFSQAMCGGDASCPSGDAINAFGGGAVAGGLLGALTGALIGSAMEKWILVAEPGQHVSKAKAPLVSRSPGRRIGSWR